MNAEDVTIGMELEAMEAMNPEGRWLPATVSRRLDADAAVWVRGLFEVQVAGPDGRLGVVTRRAGELRIPERPPARRHVVDRAFAEPRPRAAGQNAIADGRGGSAAVWWTPGAVSIEVSGGEPLDGVRVLLPIDRAGDMAAHLRAGRAFRWPADGMKLGWAIWTEPTSCGPALCASAGHEWPHPSVLLGLADAAVLAGLIESAAGEARSPARPPPARRAFAFDEFGVPCTLPPSLARFFRATATKAADTDPLAGARARTDENLRKAFG